MFGRPGGRRHVSVRRPAGRTGAVDPEEIRVDPRSCHYWYHDKPIADLIVHDDLVIAVQSGEGVRPFAAYRPW
ncbi:hypothetical protein [Streptomyces sp. NPDC101115]|uniref:hypothetical protein n=1 Tax=Streptomyces sp. NPDC101115 TaxID=3366106 RepID=UPI003812A46D